MTEPIEAFPRSEQGGRRSRRAQPQARAIAVARPRVEENRLYETPATSLGRFLNILVPIAILALTGAIVALQFLR